MRTGIVVNCRTQCSSFLKLSQAMAHAGGTPSPFPFAFWRTVEENLTTPTYDYRGFLHLKLPRLGFSLNRIGASLHALLRLLREVSTKDIHVLIRESFRDGEILAAFILECASVESVSCGLGSGSLDDAVRFIGDSPLPHLRSLTMRMDHLMQSSRFTDLSVGFFGFIRLVLTRAPLLKMLEVSDCFTLNFREEISFALLAISNALKHRNEMALAPILMCRIQGIELLTDDKGRKIVELFKQSIPEEFRPNLDMQGRLLAELSRCT